MNSAGRVNTHNAARNPPNIAHSRIRRLYRRRVDAAARSETSVPCRQSALLIGVLPMKREAGPGRSRQLARVLATRLNRITAADFHSTSSAIRMLDVGPRYHTGAIYRFKVIQASCCAKTVPTQIPTTPPKANKVANATAALRYFRFRPEALLSPVGERRILHAFAIKTAG